MWVPLMLLGVPRGALSQQPDATVPDLAALALRPTSELRGVVERWSADHGALQRRYSVEYSPERNARLRTFHSAWHEQLRALPFERLSRDAQVDYLLLASRLQHELADLDRNQQLIREMSPLLPFADTLFAMLEDRRQLIRPEPSHAARRIAAMQVALDAAKLRMGEVSNRPSRVIALRAAETMADLRRHYQAWQRFHMGYDPAITWRIAEPTKRFDAAMESWQKYLREQIVGQKEGQDEPIVGDPIGAAGLAADLRHEMIPYTPAELIAIAEREYAFLESEARRASREMGFGDDWKAAMERSKDDHAEVGHQTETVRDLAREAIRYVEENNLVTVPPLAREIWRMEMMPAAQQKVSPFFLGGEVIQVASPTDGMSEPEKLMALRANNLYGSRATVQHELIPGHHLQGFAAARSNTHRGALTRTPFYVEGWALWWELFLWDRGFARTPQERMGMLFWRMHRAARIIFSLRFHLGEWTPEEAIDFLVDKVGHERASATGEVRRSFNGSYSPLYQAGYLLGGMQLRALHRDLVSSGRMTDRAFHDAVLETGAMPIEMVRALLDPSVPLRRDHAPSWRFAN
ncbi:MAG: DUF885 family protein [Gemmatimonadales bacterium]|nr:DUF885 family protein [Gemmatimonadales bacterium]